MARYHCKACGYSIEKESKPRRCPYCSKENSLAEEENAEELIVDA